MRLWMLTSLLVSVSAPVFPLSAQPKQEVTYADKEKAKKLEKEGAAAFEKKKYEAALTSFQGAYALNPIIRYLPPIGQCASFLGRYQESADAYQKFLSSAEPDHPLRVEVERKLAEVNAKLTEEREGRSKAATTAADKDFSAGNFQAALSRYQEAHALTPSLRLLLQSARCQEKLSQPDKALETLAQVFQQTSAGDPSNIEAKELSLRLNIAMASTDYEAGRYEAAISRYLALHAEQPQPAWLLNIAKSYEALGRTQEARTNYQEFLAIAPKDDPARASVEALLQPKEPPTSTSAPVSMATSKPEEPDNTPTPKSSSSHRVFYGAGALLAGAGGVFLANALDARSDALLLLETGSPGLLDLVALRDEQARLFSGVGFALLGSATVSVVVAAVQKKTQTK